MSGLALKRVEATETTRQFYFEVTRLTFAAGTNACFLNEYHYPMTHTAWWEDGELMVALDDLIILCSPEMMFSENAGEIIVQFRDQIIRLNRGKREGTICARRCWLGAPLSEREGVLYTFLLPLSSQNLAGIARPSMHRHFQILSH